MRLFGRKRDPAAMISGWLPDPAGVTTVPGDLLGGECAGEHAYGVMFEAASRSLIFVWAFAAECGGEPGSYFVDYGLTFMAVDGQGDECWSESERGGDAAYSEWYGSVPEASEAARRSAEALLRDGADAMIQVPAGTVAGWLAWDGVPW
jgi:hypothetical protein